MSLMDPNLVALDYKTQFRHKESLELMRLGDGIMKFRNRERGKERESKATTAARIGVWGPEGGKEGHRERERE